MNNEHWIDQQEESSYRTGETCPPRNNRGMLAIFLVLAIFMCGIVTALGLLNIRLFQKSPEAQPEEASFRFCSETEPISHAQAPTEAMELYQSITLKLHQAPESVANIPQEGGLSLQEIYDRTIDSVVSVLCTSVAGDSSGSGVILSPNGYIVTNYHIIDLAQRISVLLNDGTQLPAHVVGADELSDLAVLHVETTGLTAAEFGDDTALRVGDTVVAIGDPLGIQLRGTMTNGIVSAINRDIRTGGRTMTLIQTNAALNSGNSGGPLINCYGQVIGINTMKIGDNVNAVGVEGLGFAIPSTTVKEIVDQLLSQGYVSGRPHLGMEVQTVSSFDQLYYRIPSGLYITEVQPNTDADAKGIVPGDILLSIDGQSLKSLDELQQLLYNYRAGDTVTVTLYRRGKQTQLSLILSEVT